MSKEQSTELAIFQQIQPLQIFQENKADDFLVGVEKEVEEFKKTRDISTPKGRAEIKSFSYKISQTKAPVDKAGLNLTEEARDRIDKINAERKRVREKLQAFQDDVRQPLTDYENKEKERIEVRRNRINEMGQFVPASWDHSSTFDIKKKLDELIIFDWQEFEFKAKNIYKTQIDSCDKRIEELEEIEKQEVELEKLRKEKEEREKKDREEQIIRETEKNIRRAEGEKAQRIAKEAEEARYKLEAEKKAAEQIAIILEKKMAEDVKKAKEEKEQAEIQAKKDQEEAIKAERKRAEAERQKQIDEEKAKAENLEHKTKIYKEIIDALLPYVNNNMDVVAKTKAIIAGIAKGKIPYIAIKF